MGAMDLRLPEPCHQAKHLPTRAPEPSQHIPRHKSPVLTALARQRLQNFPNLVSLGELF